MCHFSALSLAVSIRDVPTAQTAQACAGRWHTGWGSSLVAHMGETQVLASGRGNRERVWPACLRGGQPYLEEPPAWQKPSHWRRGGSGRLAVRWSARWPPRRGVGGWPSCSPCSWSRTTRQGRDDRQGSDVTDTGPSAPQTSDPRTPTHEHSRGVTVMTGTHRSDSDTQHTGQEDEEDPASRV